MIARRSAEDFLAELEDVLRRYRIGAAEASAGEKLSRADAIQRLRKLGFTTGQALRLLQRKTPRG